MGRKGMKGFMKSAARPSDKPNEAEEAAEQQEQQQQASTAAAGAGSTVAAAKATPAAPAAAAAGSDDDSDGGHGESRSKMLQRHKKVCLVIDRIADCNGYCSILLA